MIVKNEVTENKISIYELKWRLGTTEKRISDLKVISEEVIQMENVMHRDKKTENMKERLKHMEDRVKKSNIHLTGVQKIYIWICTSWEFSRIVEWYQSSDLERSMNFNEEIILK